MGLFGGIGKFVSDAFGSTNKAKAATPQVDPNAYEYGGYAGGAADQANAYGQSASNSQGRKGAQVDYAQANADRRMQLQGRAQQGQVANMMMARAQGRVPSIAQMQADRQMQQAQASQGALSASARGPAAMALAQQNAANNTAQAQSDISGQAQINAANERMQAEQGAYGAYSGMRGQDLGAQQQSAQQGQYQAGLNQQQHALNDQTSLGYSQLQNQVNTTQLAAQGNRQAQQSANSLGASGINAGVAGQNAAMNQQNALGVVGTATSVAGGIATGGATPKARGGPVAARHPYLVGEQGPELVVPKHDGIVIPAGPTAMLLGGSVPRAEGGPIATGGAPPMRVPSTWGNVQATDQDIADEQLRQDQAATVGRQSRLMANNEETPWERDARQVSALRRATPDLVNDEDKARERRAKGVIREAHRSEGREPSPEDKGSDEERAKVADGKALPTTPQPPRFSMGGMLSTLGGAASKQAAGIDTSYHGGGVPYQPMLIPIGGSRAGGGLVQAGGAPDIGGAVDLGGGGSGISSSMVKRASTGLGGGMPGMVGGGGIVGGSNVPGGGGGMMSSALGSIGSAARGMAGNVDIGYHPFEARAEGGPIQAGGAPDRGQEIALLYEPPGKEMHQGFDGRAFYRDASVIQDDGRPSLAGGGLASMIARRSPEAIAASPAPPMRIKPREKTPEELMREADELERMIQGEHAARMAAGPAVRAK